MNAMNIAGMNVQPNTVAVRVALDEKSGGRSVRVSPHGAALVQAPETKPHPLWAGLRSFRYSTHLVVACVTHRLLDR
jgi:hypothetical protein